MPRDLTSVKLMYLKAALFLVVGTLAAGLLWIEAPTARNAVLLAVMTWAFCRAYYFAFYVVGHYADPGHRNAGLIDFARYLWRRRSVR